MDYHIYHLFPKLLNAYGDRGNIITLRHFAKEMGLNPIVHEVDDVNQIDWEQIDFMLLGGGFENEVALVVEYLKPFKEQLKNKIIDGLCLLVTTSSFPVLGKQYEDSQNNLQEGLDLFDIKATYQDKVMIGNVLVDNSRFEKAIGFVNHFHEIEHDYEIIGDVLLGYGNTLTNKREGLIYKNTIATFMSGPLLAKNYNITLFFLEKFARKNSIDFDINKFDLTFEKRTFKELEIKLRKQIGK